MPSAFNPRGLLFALLCTTLAGCYGTRFTWDDARRIQPGMTEQQVVAIMGNPMTVSATPYGAHWSWAYADSFGSARSFSVIMRDGRVATANPPPAATVPQTLR